MNRLVLIALLVSYLNSYAQVKGNEWINYNQKYLKVPVTQKGFYKIDHTTLSSGLSSIGVNIQSIDPRNIQVFARGNEQAIEISGSSDGSFDPQDELYFYGEGNDGWLDKYLYQDTSGQLNPYYSLYNDTQWYFITWNALLNNKRYLPSLSTNFSGKSAASYVFVKKVNTSQFEYYVGAKDAAGASSPFFVRGEGYGSQHTTQTIKRATFFDARYKYTGANAPFAKVTTTTASISNAPGSINHRMGISVKGISYKDTSYTGYQMIKHTISNIPTSTINHSTNVEYASLPLNPAPATDYQVFGYCELEYPHQMNLTGQSLFEFYIPASNDSTHVSFTNYTRGTVDYIYDITNGVQIRTVQNGTTIQALIPPGKKRKLILLSKSLMTSVNQTFPISNQQFTNGQFQDPSKLLLDSSFIVIYHPSHFSEATAYSNYRMQTGYNSNLFSIQDLYDQFGYGISHHPMAIRNFIQYAVQSKPNAPPQYVFLIGKAVKSTSFRKQVNALTKDLVPTIGIPPADNLFVSDLGGINPEPDIPIGRLSAVSNASVIDYLDKVKQYESEQQNQSQKIDDMIWHKRGIHFAGGSDIGEQNVFTTFLSNYEQIWEGSNLAGDIFNYKRFNTGATQNLQFDSAIQLINQGVALMSFFGHGSNGQLGIDLGAPENYSNTGRYPVFIANSCNVGDYFLPNDNSVSVNESWIRAKNKGAIAFISSTSLGYTSSLNAYTTPFYNHLCKQSYGKSLGQIMKSSSASINRLNQLNVRTAVEINLHGDPALKVYPKVQADYAIEKQYINFPEFVSSEQLAFTLKVPVYNLGKSTDSLITVTIQHQFPNGGDTTYEKQFTDNALINPLEFVIPISTNRFIGENRFVIHVNPELKVPEIFPTQNNIVGNIRINVTSDDLIPVWPLDHAIVPSEDVTLSASTADPFAIEREYIFEIDETDQFNSSKKQQFSSTSKGGVISWKPDLKPQNDSTVYFWRCSPTQTSDNTKKWREHSFQIIEGKSGWSQYDFNQFKKNKFERLEYDKPNQRFEFHDGSFSVSAFNIGNPAGGEYSLVKWSIDGVQQGRVGFCRGARSILISVIDPYKIQSWETRWIDNTTTPPTTRNNERNYGNFNDPSFKSCPVTGRGDRKFQFRVDDPKQMDSAIALITKHVPDSFYLLIVSGANALFRDTTKWKERHYQLFEQLGADSIRTIKTDHPYILFTQKGNPSKTVEKVGTHRKDGISITESIQTKVTGGSMFSTVIGPSREWKDFVWSYSGNSPDDSIYVETFGIDEHGIEHNLFSVSGPTKSIINLEQHYPDIKKYPYLKLQSTFNDPIDLSAPQQNKWLITHGETPEFAINTGGHFFFHTDTVMQGEPVQIAAEFGNVGAIASDSLSINTYLRSEKKQLIQLPDKKTIPLNPNIFFKDTITVNTTKLAGLYALTLELNPLDTNWQYEGHHFNNIIQKTFFVKSDRINPLLNVTFDGIHILDGDLVSARPEIRMVVDDENLFLPLDDTTYFEVYLTDPSKKRSRVYFKDNGEDILEFTPATSEKNKCSILYHPIFNTDGVYQLEVNAKDVSGNRSGNKSYKISFEVINKSTITQVMNYPNPFTTRTHFVFTLTGYKIPEFFRIQILTIGGKVVREIDRHELGHIHIGRNITDYTWDGRDEFGDRLANGVYFYRVITKIEDEKIEHRESGADRYFKKEFGKMYLMR